jgi:hypothetical protein
VLVWLCEATCVNFKTEKSLYAEQSDEEIALNDEEDNTFNDEYQKNVWF